MLGETTSAIVVWMTVRAVDDGAIIVRAVDSGARKRLFQIVLIFVIALAVYGLSLGPAAWLYWECPTTEMGRRHTRCVL